MKLYKFRSMHNQKRFLDILINKRLYMAHYNEMNDPMEGYFYYDPAYKNLATDVSMGKQSKLICCLSTDYNLGWKMDSKDVRFYTSLIHSILGPNVEVVKMKRDDIDSGLF